MTGLAVRRILALVALACGLWAAPALAKPPVWTVHGRGATITLFGSVHVLPRKLDWQPEALKKALGQADELWFETPIDPAALLEASRLALAKGMLPEGKTLSDMLSADGKARLQREAEALRLPQPQLERLQPWLAELSIGEAAYARDGATADQGVERQLADSAPQAKRRSFETPAQQIAMFADAPQSVQVASLQDTLRELEQDPDQSRRLIEAWMKGDLKAIEKEGVEELRAESPQMFDTLLTKRNAAWVKTLLKRLDARPPRRGRPPRLVVVVGVGHLAGRDGVPELLRRKGIRVDGPDD